MNPQFGPFRSVEAVRNRPQSFPRFLCCYSLPKEYDIIEISWTITERIYLCPEDRLNPQFGVAEGEKWKPTPFNAV